MSKNGNILAIIGPLNKPKFMGLANDSFTLVVTKDQSIFAKLTSEIMKKVAEEAKQKAKKEGKGFFGQWESQISRGMNYSQRYLSMEPEEILKENSENFSIPNSSINYVEVKYKDNNDDDAAGRPEWTINIHAHPHKLSFKCNNNPKEELKNAYGEI
ncbi:hypothetical protein [uncultured Methanomethylovorans sp.]|uniref:hypothetical protein n=1 Tax=uncultured Methanomethylovorans sp. TaxID=183759 RepID=UPI002AA681A4|nr:hypothetical protein [uncultured Methanomethylovorans sp.]